MSSEKSAVRVLVMGYRQGLCNALTRMDIAHAIWNDRPLKSKRDCLHLLIAGFTRNHDDIQESINELSRFGPFTHVIAGSEASVYPAAVARRVLGARVSTQTLALRCHDKLEMKSYLRDHSIPMTDFVPGDEAEDTEAVVARLGLPMVIKSRHGSGGRGIRLVERAQDLAQHARKNKIVEKFVAAPEASVESFINQGRIEFENITRYHVKRHINLVPGSFPAQQQQALLALNRAVVAALNIRWGMTHMEAYLHPDGILFGEIALRPPGGYVMELIGKAYGFSAWEALLHMELDRSFAFNADCLSHTAVYLIHPGAGKVMQINRWDEIADMPGLYRAKSKIKPGSVISERTGVGEDAGYLLFSRPGVEDLLTDIDHVDKTLEIVMG